MKKVNIRKILCLAVIFALSIAIVLPSTVYAAFGSGFNPDIYKDVTTDDGSAGALETPIQNVYASIILLLQAAAVIGVVLMGVKYMFAASEDKAKIKQTLIWVIVGTIFVFSAPRVINFIAGAANQVIN